MPKPRYQHTVQLTEELEEAWNTYRDKQDTPESFNPFIVRLIRREMERACVIDVLISTTK